MAQGRIEDIYALSPVQEGILIQSLGDETGAYIGQLTCVLRGVIDPNWFERAWQRAVDRHPALRTSFSWREHHRPLQIVRRGVRVHLERLDLRHEVAEKQDLRFESIVHEQRSRGFDLSQPPLLRLTLASVGDNTWRFLWTYPQVLLDGWSSSTLLREVLSDVDDDSEKVSAPPFREYFHWLRSRDELAARKFWREYLDGLAGPTRLDVVRPSHRSQAPACTEQVIFSEPETAAIRTRAAFQRVTVATLVHAAWGLVLSSYSGSPDVLFGSVASARPPSLPGAEQMIGHMLQTLPVRTRFEPGMLIGEWLRDFQRNLVSAREHGHQSLAEIQASTSIPPGTPLFDTLLTFENYPTGIWRADRPVSGGLVISNLEFFEDTGMPLTLMAFSLPSLVLRIAYRPGQVQRGTVSDMLRQLQHLVNALTDHESTLGRLPLLSRFERDRQAQLGRPQHTQSTASVLLHEAFEAQATRTPDGVALVLDEDSLTYDALNRRANRIAHRLIALGVGPETPVGLSMDQSLDLVVWLIGICKAGGAYVPMEPSLPRARLNRIADEASIRVVATTKELAPLFEANGRVVITPEDVAASLAIESNLSLRMAPDNLAYVIYTSGSTGSPKGVAVTHRNVMRLLSESQPLFGFGPDDVWTLFHSYAFDFSVWEIWGALLTGARVLVVPHWVARSTDAFLDLLERRGVTILNQTPTAFRQLLRADETSPGRDLSRLRLIIFGGEALDASTLKPWFERHGDVHPQLVNMYGITETTVHVTYRRLTAHDADEANSPIGVPLPHLGVHILDNAMRAVPTGVCGELYVRGDGLARGYLGRPYATAERFVPDPWSEEPGARIYQTGDLARRFEDGNIEFAGRCDEQVKLRGHRIEPGEIESTIRRHEGVSDAAVSFQREEQGRGLLHAYVVPNETRAAAVHRLLVLQKNATITGEMICELPDGAAMVTRTAADPEPVRADEMSDGRYLGLGIALPANAAVVDLGGRTGLFALVVRRGWPDARIRVFEPDARLSEVLRINSRLHNFEPVLEDHETSVELTGGQILSRANVQRIDLLRIGLAPCVEVLRSINPVLWRAVEQVIVEVDESGADVHEVAAILREAGFLAHIAPSSQPGPFRYQIVIARRSGSQPKAKPNTERHWHGPRDLTDDIREFLAAFLPDYMIPAKITLIDALPLAPSGKVDRRALKALDASTIGQRSEPVSPRSETERILADTIGGLLDVSGVGAHDNFFELGGDSILSIQLVARARDLGLRLSPKQVFEHPTVAEMAAVAQRVVVRSVEDADADDEIPLTPIQHWFFEQELVDAHHWNQAARLRVRQPIPPPQLERALDALYSWHDALRLRFVRDRGEWRQLSVRANEPPALKIVDLSALDDTSLTACLDKVLEETQSSLDLADGPLLRAILIRFGNGVPDELLLVLHHLTVDGVSWRVLLEDLSRACEMLAGAEPITRPPASSSWRKWASQLSNHASAGEWSDQLDYWLAHAELPKSEADTHSGPFLEANALHLAASLNPDETTDLYREVPAAWRASPVELLLAALVHALSRVTGARQVLIEMEGHGREPLSDEIDISRTVGWFTTLFPLAISIPEDGVSAAVAAVKRQLRAAPTNGFGFGILRYIGDPAARERLRRLPRPSIRFNYLGRMDAEAARMPLFEWRPSPHGRTHSSRQQRACGLDVELAVRNGCIQLELVYDFRSYGAQTMEHLAAEFVSGLRTLIATAVKSGAAALTPSDFPLAGLDEASLSAILRRATDVEDIYPLAPVQSGILFHALYSPESTVYFDEFAWTFIGPLDRAALRRAWRCVTERYAMLRTSFVWEGLTEPLQVVHAEPRLDWEEHDWQSIPATDVQRELHRFSAANRRRRFNLAAAPLNRIALIQLSAEQHRIIWSHHHILLDGWCIDVLLGDFMRTYDSLRSEGTPPRLEHVRPYRDYVAWLARQDSRAAEMAWRQELSGFNEPTPLPLARTETASRNDDSDYTVETTALSRRTSAGLRRLAQRNGLTLNTLLQGAWALVLAHHSGRNDVGIGCTVAGRPPSLSGVERMVGPFLNTIAVRVRVEAENRLLSWLRALQRRQVGLRHYEHCSLAQIKRWSEMPERMPLFETAIVFENVPARDFLRQNFSGLRISDVRSFVRNNFPLTLRVVPTEQIGLHFLYETPRLRETSIRILSRQLSYLLDSFTSEPTRTLTEFMAELAALDRELRQQREHAGAEALRLKLRTSISGGADE